MAMDESDKLRQRIAELEKILADEREEHVWDLKAAQETAVANQRMLEEEKARLTLEMTRLKRRGPAPAEDVEQLTQRALQAESKVAELQQQLVAGRNTGEASAQGGLHPSPRQEEAQRQMDKLAREVAELKAKLDEKQRALSRAEERAREGRDARLEAESLRQRVEAQKQELETLREEVARTKMASGQMIEHREREVGRLKLDQDTVQEELRQLQEKQILAMDEIRDLTKRLLRAEKERDNLQEEMQAVTDRVPTEVGRLSAPPEQEPPEAQPEAEAVTEDPFEETTHADKDPRGAKDSEPPAVAADLVDGQSGQGFLPPEPGASASKARPTFAKGSTLIGTGVDEAADAFELAVGSSPDESAAAPLPLGSAGLEVERLEPLDELEMFKEPEDHAEREVGSLLAEGLPTSEPNSPGSVAGQEQTLPPELPPSDEVRVEYTDVIRRRKPLAGLRLSKGWLVGGGLLLGGLLVLLGVWRFAPGWFGEGEAIVLGADAGSTLAPSDDAGWKAGLSDGPLDAGGERADADDSGDADGQGASGADEVAADVAADVSGKDDLALLRKPYQRSKKVSRAIKSLRNQLKRRRYAKALVQLESLVEANPADATLRFLYGQALYLDAKRFGKPKRLERWRKAVEQFRQALLLKPDMADAYFEIGGLSLNLGEKEEARGAMESYLQLRSKGAKARSARKILRKL